MPKVVVVGGGMAGVACALELGRKDVEVVLVDRHDYLQFQPLLYQVASSQLPAEDVARPLKVVFEDRPSVDGRPDGRRHRGCRHQDGDRCRRVDRHR